MLIDDVKATGRLQRETQQGLKKSKKSDMFFSNTKALFHCLKIEQVHQRKKEAQKILLIIARSL